MSDRLLVPSRRSFLRGAGSLGLIAALPRIARAQQPAAGFRFRRGLYIPAGVPRLNRDHRLSYGLNFASAAGLSPALDIVSGKRASSVNSNVSFGAGETGQEARFQNGTALTDGIIWLTRPFITTSNGAGTGDFTMAVVAAPTPNATEFNFLISQRVSTGSLNQVYFCANLSTSGSQASGWLTFDTYSGTHILAGAASQVDGAYHAFVAKRTGIATAVYRDGLSVGTGSGTVQNILNTSQDFDVGGLAQDNTNARGSNCPVSFAACWNRALADDEIMEWSKDPTCMLIYPDDDILAAIVGRVAGAGAKSRGFILP